MRHRINLPIVRLRGSFSIAEIFGALSLNSQLSPLNFHLLVPENKKRGGKTSPPPLNVTAAISYLWPECVIRARMSRRLSSTVEPANSARSAALHLACVALMAAAHLSMPSALG